MLDRAVDVAVIGLVILTLDREDGNPVIDERRRDIVLRRKRVRGAKHGVRAASLEGQGEVRGLGGDVRAGKDAETGQRLLGLEPLADLGQHRHLAGSPLDAAMAGRGQRRVLDVEVLGVGRSCRHE